MKISVIVTSYNYAAYLPQAVESALNQVDCEQEVIIVDDGSTDNSPQIAEGYAARDARVRCIRKPNGGQGSAFNAGYAAAQGDILAFLDADDFWYPQKLSTVEAFHCEWGMVQHNLLVNGELPYAFLEEGAGQRQKLHQHGYAAAIPTSGLSITRPVAERIFPLPEAGTEICADLYVRYAGLMHSDMWTTNEPLGYYRMHDRNAWYRSGDTHTRDRVVSAINEHARSVGWPQVPTSHHQAVANALTSNIRLAPGTHYVIYGAGNAGKSMLDAPSLKKSVCIGFVDSNPDKWGTQASGLSVYPPSSLKEFVRGGAKILVGSMFAAEILQTLEAMGFREGEHVILPRI